jgi:hypothetical protein
MLPTLSPSRRSPTRTSSSSSPSPTSATQAAASSSSSYANSSPPRRGIRYHSSETADGDSPDNVSGRAAASNAAASATGTSAAAFPSPRKGKRKRGRKSKGHAKSSSSSSSSSAHDSVGGLAPIHGSGVLKKQAEDERRRRQRRQAKQVAAESRAATAEAAEMASWQDSLFGLAATTAGQDTPPMSAGSAVSLARTRQAGVRSPPFVSSSSHRDWQVSSPPLSAAYRSNISTSTTNSNKRHNSRRRKRTPSTAGYRVPQDTRLRTPDLDMMQTALHGSLFQRLQTNFKAGLVGNDLRQSGDIKGLQILDALTTDLASEEEEKLAETLEEAHNGDMAYYDNLVLAGLPAQPEAWEQNARFSRQGFPSTTPRPGSALSMLLHFDAPDGRQPFKRNRRSPKPKPTAKGPAKLRNAAGRVIPRKNDLPPPVNPAFSTKLLAEANPSLYWDVKSVSHEVKYATIEFQRLVRGHLARLFTAEFRYRVKLQKMKRAHAAATKAQAIARGFLKRYMARDIVLASPSGCYLMNSPTLLATANPYLVPLLYLFDWIRRITAGPTGMQKIWRGMIGRRQALGHKIYVLRCRLEKKMATKIQALWRGCIQPPKWRARLANYAIVRDWMRRRVIKLRAIRLGTKVRAQYLRKRQAAIEIQRWFPRAVETRGLARVARDEYLQLYAANIVCQSFVRMIIAINTMNYLSAVREQDRLAERRRVERERLAELERQRMLRRNAGAVVIQTWIRPRQARVRVQVARARHAERETVYVEFAQAWDSLMEQIGGHAKITRKTEATPAEALVFMQCELPVPGVAEDMALLEGHKDSGPGGQDRPSLGLDDWYYHNLMTQPNSALLKYGRALVEYYRTGEVDAPEVQKYLRAGRIVDPGLYHQRRFVDVYETAWRHDMDNGFKGCCYALVRMLMLGDVLGAAKAMRRARRNVKYDQRIVRHASQFEKRYATLVARGDHFVDQVYETVMVLPPGRTKYRVQVFQHGRNLQFRSLRYDFVTSGVKPSGAESRLVFACPDAAEICRRLDRPELLRAGRVTQLIESLIPMLVLANENPKDAGKFRKKAKNKNKKKTNNKAGGKFLVVQFKQEPFPKLTTLTKGQGKLSLGEKFLTIVALHRVDGGFELWARGDMTAPPAGNPTDDYKLLLPFKKLKRLFLDYPVLWQAQKYPGWRARSDTLLAMIVERIEIAEKPKPEKKGVHQMSFEELMRMSHAVAKQEASLEASGKSSRKGVEVVDVPPELVMLYHDEKARLQQAERNWGAMCLQKCWRGLLGRRRAKLQRAHLATLVITHFLFRQRARVWFRQIRIFSRRHFNAIRAQSVMRGALARLYFCARLRQIFPFSRGAWSVAAPAMAAQRLSPLFLRSNASHHDGGGILQPYQSIGRREAVKELCAEHTALSELTHRVMWAMLKTTTVARSMCCDTIGRRMRVQRISPT